LKKLGGVKIGDLGFSKSIANITKKTSKFSGTVNYMSPEMINEEADYTNKIDVWAYGCVVYELITLEKLFHDKSEFKIKKKILEETITLPADVDPTFKQILKG
jgi:serine/threonine protein kinase